MFDIPKRAVFLDKKKGKVFGNFVEVRGLSLTDFMKLREFDNETFIYFLDSVSVFESEELVDDLMGRFASFIGLVIALAADEEESRNLFLVLPAPVQAELILSVIELTFGKEKEVKKKNLEKIKQLQNIYNSNN